MAKLEADLLINTRQFVAEAKKAGTSLDDIVKAYDDVAEESGRTEKDVIADLKRISKATDDVGDDAKRNFKQFADAGSDNLGNFKDEAKANFAEVASSFDGSIDGMTSGVQGLTGGLASALTPGIGIPIAILGAAAATFLAQWQESAEKTEQRVSDMYDDMIESGQNFLSEDFLRKSIAEIIADPEQMKTANDIVDRTGARVQDVLRAMAGEQSSINSVVDQGIQKRDEEIRKIEGSGRSLEDQSVQVDAINTKYDTTIDKLTGVESNTQKAVDQAALYRSTVDTANDALDDQQQKVKDVEAAVREFTDRTWTVNIDANTAEFERKVGLLQGRKIVLNVDGQITRIGNQVW